MATIILTIYAIFATLAWGVSVGRKMQQEKNDREKEEIIQALVDGIAEIAFPDLTHVKGIPHALTEMQKDLKANLQGTQAVVKAMVDIKDSATKFVDAKPEQFEQGPEFYIHNLEYARDHLELTPMQRNTLNAIISKMGKKYGR
jgi:hypothetical protein